MKNKKDILKWFNNELTLKEIEDLKQTENLETLNKIAHYASQLKTPEVDVQKAFEDFKTRKLTKKAPKVRTLNFKTFYKIAAVLVVMLTSSYFLFFNNIKTFNTNIAETEEFVLPDASVVVLNAQSKISYNKKTWQNNRDLNLDGEAYFKVSKGQKFSVNTDVGVIQVLGTQFNVKERDNYFEVRCFEGLVSVTYNNETVKLAQGKTFRVVNKTIEAVEDFNTESPSWIKLESSFEKIPLALVIAELEIQYDIKIETNNINTSQLFTGTFTHSNKNIALQSVTIPLKLSYKIDGKKVEFYNYEGP